MKRQPKAYRFKASTIGYLKALQDYLGVSEVAAVEIAIREAARKRHLTLPEPAKAIPAAGDAVSV